MKRSLLAFIVCALPLLGVTSSPAAPKKATTLEDLKKLDIICLVPGWLPKGYRLKEVGIDNSDTDTGDDGKSRVYPGYNIEYRNGKKGSFTIESARTGIGDRNLDENDRAEESQIDTKRLGAVYIIYFPPGKSGIKTRIKANWIKDSNMINELAASKDTLPVKGRFHGVSGFGMTLAEFEKIVQSLHPLTEK